MRVPAKPLVFPYNLKNRTPLLVPGQEESEGLPTPAVESEESEPAILHSNDSVLLTDGIKCWIVRIEDIIFVERADTYAASICSMTGFSVGRTLEFASAGWRTPPLRASRGYIVDLSHVKQPRLLEDERLSFLLNDGKEVLFFRRQSVHFRKTRGL